MATPEPLDGNQTRKWLKQLLKSKEPALIAVAYWGKGAVTSLGLNQRTAETRVLCDLYSGACNPDEIQLLLDQNIEVRKLDRLHAKVYCTQEGIVIGSSNASANGLGHEGTEVSGNVELNTLIREPDFRKGVEAWFGTLWARNDALPVTTEMIEYIRPIYNKNKMNREQTPPPYAVLPHNITDQALAERLIVRFIVKAREILKDGWRTDITAETAARLMAEDAHWRDAYTQFVGGNPYGSSQKKRAINPQFGKRLRNDRSAGVGSTYLPEKPSIFNSKPTRLLPPKNAAE